MRDSNGQVKGWKGGSLTGVFQQTEFTLRVVVMALFVITSVCTDNFFSVYNTNKPDEAVLPSSASWQWPRP